MDDRLQRGGKGLHVKDATHPDGDGHVVGGVPRLQLRLVPESLLGERCRGCSELHGIGSLSVSYDSTTSPWCVNRTTRRFALVTTGPVWWVPPAPCRAINAASFSTVDS